MMTLCRRGRVLAGALAVALAATLPANLGAQRPDGARDLQTIGAYPLSMPKYRQYLDAMVSLANTAEANPSAFQGLEGSGELSLDEQVALYDKNSTMRGAIAGAGMTMRDFLLTQYALFQAGMAHALMKQYNLSADSVSKATRVSRENLRFFEQNEAELNRLGEEARAKMPRVPEEEAEPEDGGMDDGGESGT